MSWYRTGLIALCIGIFINMTYLIYAKEEQITRLKKALVITENILQLERDWIEIQKELTRLQKEKTDKFQELIQNGTIQKWAKENGFNYPTTDQVRMYHDGEYITLTEHLEEWKQNHTCLHADVLDSSQEN